MNLEKRIEELEETVQRQEECINQLYEIMLNTDLESNIKQYTIANLLNIPGLPSKLFEIDLLNDDVKTIKSYLKTKFPEDLI
jgi:hypothetical protein